MTTVSPSVSTNDRLGNHRELAPIALFVYNRPEHTQNTVKSLRGNELASQSESDPFFRMAPKDEGGLKCSK